MRLVNWDEAPLLMTIADLRQLGLGRDEAYRTAHRLGRQLGRKLFVPKTILRRWLEERQEA